MQLTAGSEKTLTSLKVIVYGTGAASEVAVDGVNYTVAWANQEPVPSVPVGNVGSITDRDVSYASEMYFDLWTDGSEDHLTFDGDLQFCIPVTLATVKRITVVGYDEYGNVVFAKTSTLATPVELTRSTMYPVAKIEVD